MTSKKEHKEYLRGKISPFDIKFIFAFKFIDIMTAN